MQKDANLPKSKGSDRTTFKAGEWEKEFNMMYKKFSSFGMDDCRICGFNSIRGKEFIHTLLSTQRQELVERLEKEIDNLGKTITQQGVDPEHRLKPDKSDIKREMHNRGRAYGYLEAIGNVKRAIELIKEI